MENNRNNSFRVQCNHLRQDFLARQHSRGRSYSKQQWHEKNNQKSSMQTLLQANSPQQPFQRWRRTASRCDCTQRRTRTHLQLPQYFEHNQHLQQQLPTAWCMPQLPHSNNIRVNAGVQWHALVSIIIGHPPPERIRSTQRSNQPPRQPTSTSVALMIFLHCRYPSAVLHV